MAKRYFCEGCLHLIPVDDLIITDLIPTDFHGRYSDPDNDRDVEVCDNCWDLVENYGWTELLRLKERFGTVGIGIAPIGKTVSFRHKDWYLRVYCGQR